MYILDVGYNSASSRRRIEELEETLDGGFTRTFLACYKFLASMGNLYLERQKRIKRITI